MKNKMNYYLKIIFIVSILFLILYSSRSCLREYPKNEVSYRDSVLINYALYYIAEGKAHSNWFQYFSSMDLDSSYFKIEIENMYYSPDSLKALVFITVNYKDTPIKGVKLDTNIYINGLDIALIRDNISRPWKLYFVNACGAAGWSDGEEVRIILEEYYRYNIKSKVVNGHSDIFTFEEILENRGYILDSNNEIIVNPKYTKNEQIGISNKFDYGKCLKDYKNEYGLDDEEFWTESVIWKKGIRLPDLYLFQTNSHIIKEDYMMNYNIQYPDSIIQMYKEK